MKSNSKVVRDKIKQHIIDCVYDYEENEFPDIKSAANHLNSEFNRVTGDDHFVKRMKSDQERFSYYLMGLPFHFHFYSHDIQEYLNSLGINPKGIVYDDEKSMTMYHYLIFSEMLKAISK